MRFWEWLVQVDTEDIDQWSVVQPRILEAIHTVVVRVELEKVCIQRHHGVNQQEAQKHVIKLSGVINSS
jgi:hypothetical protein